MPNTPSSDAPGSALIPTNEALSDLSGGDDDSPTATESASLAGPFIKDVSHGAGPPSVPRGLTFLLASDNWVEFTWAPSVDDLSVEAYEIYRDGQLIATVRGDTGYEHDYRIWISTSYMDCNYTRFTYCGGIQPTPGSSYSYSVAAIDNEGMSSERSTPVMFRTEQLSASPVDLTGYNAVFTEEFNGSSLDRSRWKTSLPWGPDRTINVESQYFVNTFGNNPPAYDPFVFTGETLRITGIETPAELRQSANNKPYMSGVITSADYFELTYGYLEMSAKVAGGEGLLSTFYLFNQNFEKNKPEIDILEYVGSRVNTSYQTYHYYDSNRARWATGEKHSTPTMEAVNAENLSAGFHTYAVLWEPGFVVWYIDGLEVRRLSGTRISDEPMNIIGQMVMGSEWIGSPIASSIPAVFEIDYIRAWQKQ
jgi:beta-glucanase (GH16 family)